MRFAAHGEGLAVLFLISSAASGQQVFSDRAAFSHAVEHSVVIEFDDPVIGPVIGDPWAGVGVVFDEALVGDNMEIGDGGGANNNIFARGGQAADIDITMTRPINAFGLGVFSNNIQTGSERLVFSDSDGQVIVEVPMPLTAFQGTAFVGVIATRRIAAVAFIEDDADGDYAGIGDVVFEVSGSPPLLVVSGPRVHSGNPAVFHVHGASASGPVLLAAGAHRGSTPGPCPGVPWGLDAPVSLGVLWADAAGHAEWASPGLPDLPGAIVQVYDPVACSVSPPFTFPVTGLAAPAERAGAPTGEPEPGRN